MALPKIVNNAHSSRLQGYSPPYIYNGNVYVVTHSTFCRVWKATDPVDGSFTEQDSSNVPTSAAGSEELSTVQDGAKIHMVFTGASNTGYFYARFDCSSDTWDTVDTSSTRSTIIGLSSTGTHQHKIVIVNGTCVIAYTGDQDRVMGGDKWRVDYATRSSTATSGAWSTGNALDAGGDIHYFNPLVTASPNGSTTEHFYWIEETDTTDPPTTCENIQMRTRTGGTLGTNTKTVALTTQTNGVIFVCNHAIVYDNGSSQDIIKIIGGENFTGDMVVATGTTASLDIGNASSTLTETEYDLTVGIDDGPTGNTIQICPARDPDNDDLHAIYTRSNDFDLYYMTSDDGGSTWSTPTSEVTGTIIYGYPNIYTRSGTKRFAYIYKDDVNDDVYYNEIDLGGGTQTPKALSYTGTGTAGLTLQTQKVLSTTGTGGSVLSLVKDFQRTFANTGTGAAAITKQTQKTFANTGTGTAGFAASKVSFVTANMTATGAAALIRQTQKNVSFSGTGAAALASVVNYVRAFSYGGTGTASLATAKTILRSFSYTGTGTAGFNKTLIKFVTANMTATGTAALVRQTNKDLLFSGAGTSSLARAITYARAFGYTGTGTASAAQVLSALRSFSYTGTGTAGFAKTLLRFVNAVMTGTGAAALTRQTGKPLSYSGVGSSALVKDTTKSAFANSGTGTAALTRQTQKVLAYTGTGTSVLDASRVTIKTLAYTATGTAGLVRETGKLLTYSGLGTSALGWDVSKSMAFSGTAAAALLKEVAKSFTYTGTGTPTALAELASTVEAVMTGTGTAGLTKQVGKALTFSGVGTAGFVRAITFARLFSVTGTGTPGLQKDIDVAFQVGATGTPTGVQDFNTAQDANMTGTGTLATIAQKLSATGSQIGTAVKMFFAGLNKWF